MVICKNLWQNEICYIKIKNGDKLFIFFSPFLFISDKNQWINISFAGANYSNKAFDMCVQLIRIGIFLICRQYDAI